MKEGHSPDVLKMETGRDKLRRWLRTEKLGNTPGVVLLVLAGVGISAAIAAAGLKAGLLVIAACAGLPVAYAVVVYPRFGILLLMFMAFFLFYFIRMGIDFPLGTLLDGIQGLLILGFLMQQKARPEWGIFRNPVSYLILAWIGYNLLQVFNPWAESRMAWVYTVRSVAVVMLMYFVFLYQVRSLRFVRTVIHTWLAFAFMGALYALKQEFIGFKESEFAHMSSDPLLTSLLYIDGHWRKYSIFSDPVAFSYNMAAATMICLAIASGKVSATKRIVLAVLACTYLGSMLYSGTRGAYVLIPAGLALFGILRFNRAILVFMTGAALVLGVLILVPTSNPTLYRFQTAFKPSTDASFNVRQLNHKKIQPDIQRHPLGGGLGSTGMWGVRFSPGSFLAGFPPDSGYLRVAVELGWIGLLLFCCLVFTMLNTGIDKFYRIRNPELKSYCLAMTLVIFVLGIGNYPQEALVQFPSSINFYLAISLIVVCGRLDRPPQTPLNRN